MTGPQPDAAAGTPRVRLVVVNYEGGDMTLRCLASLAGLHWPPERMDIVLVDNASTDGVADRVECSHPEVRVVRNPRNLGFTGGCNAGFRDLEGVAYVGIVNNDAVVEPSWLRSLVQAMEADSRMGAVNGKVVFMPRFCPVDLAGIETFVPGKGDARTLGVRLSGVEVNGVDGWAGAVYGTGFWPHEQGPEPEPRFRWTAGAARLWVPAERDGAPPASARLRLAGPVPRRVTLNGVEVDIGVEPTWVDVALGGPWTDLLNSTGGMLLPSMHGADRSFEQPDDGSHDQPSEIFGWTGAAVLLRSSYLADVGLFDERFFMYYEDFDLSLRGRAKGWRYGYVPEAVVRHVHSASSGATSAFVLHHLERNRLLALTRSAPLPVVARVLGEFAATTVSASVRELARSVRAGNGISTRVARQRLGVVREYARRAPGVVRSRWTTRRSGASPHR